MSTATITEQVFGEPISIYTRADALADGILRTLDPALCRDYGIGCPVDITARAFAETIQWGSAEAFRKPAALQDETGRAADVLVGLRSALRRADHPRYGDHETFHVYRIPPTGRGLRPRRHALVARFGHDGTQPVITITEEDED